MKTKHHTVVALAVQEVGHLLVALRNEPSRTSCGLDSPGERAPTKSLNHKPLFYVYAFL